MQFLFIEIVLPIRLFLSYICYLMSEIYFTYLLLYILTNTVVILCPRKKLAHYYCCRSIIKLYACSASVDCYEIIPYIKWKFK